MVSSYPRLHDYSMTPRVLPFCESALATIAQTSTLHLKTAYGSTTVAAPRAQPRFSAHPPHVSPYSCRWAPPSAKSGWLAEWLTILLSFSTTKGSRSPVMPYHRTLLTVKENFCELLCYGTQDQAIVHSEPTNKVTDCRRDPPQG